MRGDATDPNRPPSPDPAPQETDEAKRSFWRRREVLVAGLGAAALVPLVFVNRQGKQVAFVERYIRARLPDLNMDDGQLRAYARDFIANASVVPSKTFQILVEFPSMLFGADRAGTLPQLVKSRLETIESELLKDFFVSTDYLTLGGGSGEPLEPVSYFGWADAFELGCVNPWARFDDGGEPSA